MNIMFQIFIYFCVILNTAILACDRHPISPKESFIYDNINFALTWVFFIELIIKLLGLGLREFVKDRFNIFDTVVVFTSLFVDLYFLITAGKKSNRGISSLRGFRLFRIFKLARNWKSF